MDNSPAAGTGTLLDGSVLEAGRAASEVRLRSRVRLQLAAGTRVRLQRDRVVVERGEARLLEVPARETFQIDAAGFRVRAGAGSAGVVVVPGGDRVQVGSTHGWLQVRSKDGGPLARLDAGRAIDLDPSPGASAATELTGTLWQNGGRYLLRDEVSGLTFEIRAAGLERYAGLRVEVTGARVPEAMADAGTWPVIQATSVKPLRQDRQAAGARSSPAGSRRAVIAGVVVAAAVTGTTLAVTGAEDTISR